MEITVTERPAYAPPVEIVERKGRGHPDTICDGVAEALACRIARLGFERTGRWRHFNVDKSLLVAGAAEVGYGGGRVVRPLRLTVAGRADLRGSELEVEELEQGMREDFHRIVPTAPEGAASVRLDVSPTSPELAELSLGPEGVPLANDTSYAVVSLPRSPLERAVHGVEEHLIEAVDSRRLPIGPDVKVMGLRTGQEPTLTVAAAVLAEHVDGPEAYRAVVDELTGEVREVGAQQLATAPDVYVNQTPGPYLTVTGTSAEAGDDGQVGRGNRFGGLIAPFRPAGAEAAAGKNPVSHVGKTYHAIAHDIATRMLGEAGVEEATVGLLSRIGQPVTEPQSVQVDTAGRRPDRAVVEAAVRECLADWEGVRDRLLAGDYELF